MTTTIKVDDIPDDVVGVLRGALDRSEYLDAAIAAALNAWPGMGVRPHTVTTFASCIILPLPQEVSDE